MDPCDCGFDSDACHGCFLDRPSDESWDGTFGAYIEM